MSLALASPTTYVFVKVICLGSGGRSIRTIEVATQPARSGHRIVDMPSLSPMLARFSCRRQLYNGSFVTHHVKPRSSPAEKPCPAPTGSAVENVSLTSQPPRRLNAGPRHQDPCTKLEALGRRHSAGARGLGGGKRTAAAIEIYEIHHPNVHLYRPSFDAFPASRRRRPG